MAAPALGSAAIRGALAAARVPASQVQEVIFGNVVSAGVGQAPARQASKGAGIPDSAVATTVNKVCASGMKALTLGQQAVALGHADVLVAGGMESMSSAPYYVPQGRYGARYGHSMLLDALVKDALWDPYNDMHMGSCGEKAAREGGFSRADQDAYATMSFNRARAAAEGGRFAAEIVPVGVRGKGGKEVLVTTDEQWGKVDFARMATLKPAFAKDGSITAANASALNDGASALVLMSAEKAKADGITPLARIVGYADAEQAPIDFPSTPWRAVTLALSRAGLAVSDVSFHEINEAFAVVAMLNARMLGLSLDTVNVNGGAVALGHPVGCSGARIVTTLIHVLQQRDAQFGTASICNGGGGATAVVIERLS